MNLDATLEANFKENINNVLKWGDTIKENIKAIAQTKNIDFGLYMTKVYVIDDEGYFRGFMDFCEHDGPTPKPKNVFDNKGNRLLECAYIGRHIYREGYYWTDGETEEKTPRKEIINYVLENTEQIREPIFKIKKPLLFKKFSITPEKVDITYYRRRESYHKNFKKY